MNCPECGAEKSVKLRRVEPFHVKLVCERCGETVEEHKKDDPPKVNGPETYQYQARQRRNL